VLNVVAPEANNACSTEKSFRKSQMRAFISESEKHASLLHHDEGKKVSLHWPNDNFVDEMKGEQSRLCRWVFWDLNYITF
jgi:hypothetical protein